MVTASVRHYMLIGLVLLLLMAGTVVLIEYESGRSMRVRMATVGEQVAGVIDGAAHTATQAAVLAGEDCLPHTQERLAAILAHNPVVRGIRLLDQGRIVCTAFVEGEAAPLPAGWRMSPGWFLTVSARDERVPGMPVLLLVDGRQERGVVVSISSASLRPWLRGGPDRPSLILLAGGQSLDQAGWQQRAESGGDTEYHDTRWPFSLRPDPVRSFSWWTFLSDCWLWLLLCSGVTFLSVRFCHRLLVLPGQDTRRLQRAIRRGEIHPWYQPVVCSVSGAVSGCEVLARWFPPEGKMVMPDDFIPLAEKTGQTVLITRQLMRQVEADLLPVLPLLPEAFHVAINVTSAELLSPAFESACRQLITALKERRVQLVLEITERSPVQGSPALQRAMAALRRQGIKVALDDFGTGQAGLTGLEHLTVDYIKLDRSFTAGAGQERKAGEGYPVAALITGMAEQLNIEVVAEGVETTRQRNWLKAHGVRWLQGWLFSPPLSAQEFIRWLGTYQGTEKNCYRERRCERRKS